MRNKTIKLTIIFLAIFSSNGFSQTTEKSAHPLLDKYYPQPKKETPQTPVPTPVTTIAPQKPVVAPVKSPAADLSPIEEPTKTVTIIKPTVDSSNTTIVETNKANFEINNKPALVPVPAITPKTSAVPPPPESTYNRSRLGSSSPQYNTWEKNSNGAGSVTTHSK